MFPRLWWIVVIGASLRAPSAVTSVVFGSPPAGPVVLHDGSLNIDFNGDGTPDLTITVRGIGTGAKVQGSQDWVYQAMNVGVFRGIWSGPAAWPLSIGQQVGPPTGYLLYSDPGLGATSEFSATGEFVNAYDYSPGWADGSPHYMGVDVPSGPDHHFGWVEVSIQDSGVPTTLKPWYDLTVYGWAYETQPNQAITIPEPSPLAPQPSTGDCRHRRAQAWPIARQFKRNKPSNPK